MSTCIWKAARAAVVVVEPREITPRGDAREPGAGVPERMASMQVCNTFTSEAGHRSPSSFARRAAAVPWVVRARAGLEDLAVGVGLVVRPSLVTSFCREVLAVVVAPELAIVRPQGE